VPAQFATLPERNTTEMGTRRRTGALRPLLRTPRSPAPAHRCPTALPPRPREPGRLSPGPSPTTPHPRPRRHLPARSIAAAHAAGLLTATVSPPTAAPATASPPPPASCEPSAVATLRSPRHRHDPVHHAAQSPHAQPGPSRSTGTPRGIRRAPHPRQRAACGARPRQPRPRRSPGHHARRGHDGAWHLTGHKIFSTGAVALRWMAVYARTDEDPTRVGSFLIRSDSPASPSAPPGTIWACAPAAATTWCSTTSWSPPATWPASPSPPWAASWTWSGAPGPPSG